MKIKNYDNDAPSVFQNYSHCFNELRLPQEVNLTNTHYRSINGHGNNLKYPKRGESFTSYGRMLKAHYDDHIHTIRKSNRGYELPSPRNIVRKLFLNDIQILNKFEGRKRIPNMAAIMFGQLIAHDTGSRQITQYVDGNNGM